MTVHNSLYGSQIDSSPIRLGAEKGIENKGDILWVNAASIVGYGDSALPLALRQDTEIFPFSERASKAFSMSTDTDLTTRAWSTHETVSSMSYPT